MKWIKAFGSGILIPAIVSPFIIMFLFMGGNQLAVKSLPFIYFGPILWGLWNVVFFYTRYKVPIENRNTKIGVYGAFYGLITALINSLWFDFTSEIAILPDFSIILAILLYPVLLYFVWRYLVNVLNIIFDVY